MHNWSDCTAIVVEDSTMQRTHAAGLLRQAGFGTVLEACDGIDALHVIENCGGRAIDLVVTDLDMPGMDGIELIQHLGERKLTVNLIVMSARDPRLLESVENMGSDDAGMCLLGTVMKPMRIDDLSKLLLRVDKIKRANAVSVVNSPVTFEELEAALAAGQFIPFFQPKISVQTGLVKGVEALARWQHPERGMVAPFYFIPAIEGTPLMAPFTLAIIEQSLSQLAAWRALGLSQLTVSVNLSADNLADRNFIDQLSALVARYQIPPSAMIWEVTETMVMSNLSQALANLARMSLKGFGLAMDDYGIGYSSVQQLSRCPFTELKIDRVFVHEAAQRQNRRAILESSIEMGRRLGITTVAEGVEQMADWELLRALGCESAQGYLIATPMPGASLVTWIRDNRSRLMRLVSAPKQA